MFRKFTSRTYCVLPAILCLSLSISVLTVLLSGCSKKEQNEPEQPGDHSADVSKMVYQTDSTEWHVCLIATSKTYAQAVQIAVHAPYRLPTRDEATIMRTLTYGDGSERFVTSDGYTFGMPSASVTKAGQKTKYSVLGLWIRKTTIDVTF